jgi:hypothetical protein
VKNELIVRHVFSTSFQSQKPEQVAHQFVENQL